MLFLDQVCSGILKSLDISKVMGINLDKIGFSTMGLSEFKNYLKITVY